VFLFLLVLFYFVPFALAFSICLSALSALSALLSLFLCFFWRLFFASAALVNSIQRFVYSALSAGLLVQNPA